MPLAIYIHNSCTSPPPKTPPLYLSVSVHTPSLKVIGDNPTLVEELRKVQAAAEALRQENETLRTQLDTLCKR